MILLVEIGAESSTLTAEGKHGSTQAGVCLPLHVNGHVLLAMALQRSLPHHEILSQAAL